MPIDRFIRAVVVAISVSFAAPALGEWTDDAQRCYMASGDTSQTIQYCTRAIESGKLTNSELSTTYSNRGGVYETRGDLELAIADLNAAVRLNPDNAGAHFSRGNFYRRRGEETKARAEFDIAISKPVAADRAWDYITRARAKRAKGDTTSALSDLDEAHRIDPKIREIYIERAGMYSGRSDHRRAIEAYDAALGLNSGDAVTLASRGNAYSNLGNYQQALADYNSAISFEPNVAQRYVARAAIHWTLGNLDLAIEDYTHAIRLEPNRGLRYTARASAYRGKGDWKRAMADNDRAIQVEPDRGTYWNARAGAREYEGDYRRAIEDRNEAVRLQPRDADLQVSRGWTLLYAGRTDEALAGFANAISMDPSAARRYDSRGHALLVLGRFDDALRDFDRAIQIEPARGVHYAWRAWVGLYRGDPAAGIGEVDRAAAVDRDYVAEAASSRGFLRLAALQLDESIREYTTYLRDRPNAASGFANRGLAHMMKGDLRAATADFQQALQYNAWDRTTLIWLHLCRARLGEDARSETMRHVRRHDPQKWPAPAFKLLLGEASVDDMLAAAKEPSSIKTREQEAQAHFIAGHYYLSIKRPGEARRMFQEALNRNVPYTQAHAGAKAALRALAN